MSPRKAASIGLRVLVALWLAAPFARAEEAPIIAKWEPRIVKFRYSGFTTYYTCDGLRDKLRRVLIAAGARADAKVQVSCPGSFNQAFSFLNATAGFSVLRVNEGPITDDSVRANWGSVKLNNRRPREIERGDCELIEQFTDQILPLFGARDVADHTVCTPRSGGWPKVEFTVLRPIEAESPGAPK